MFQQEPSETSQPNTLERRVKILITLPAFLSRKGIHFNFPNVKEIRVLAICLRPLCHIHPVRDRLVNLTTKKELQQPKSFQIADVSGKRARKTQGNYFSNTTQISILSWQLLAYQSPVWPCRLHEKDQPMDESAISVTVLLGSYRIPSRMRLNHASEDVVVVWHTWAVYKNFDGR
jgi:hypothetical protein